MSRTGFIILSALTLTACEVINHDRTLEPAMAQFVNHSYTINKDSFLLENYCLDEYTTSRCLYMQEIGGHILVFRGIGNRPVDLPKNFQDYAKNKGKYDESLRDNTIFHHTEYKIVAEVPKGTVIRITRLVSIAEGETGRAWAVYGQIASQGTDVSIQIGPGYIGQDGPWWFYSSEDLENNYLPPRLNPEFLSPLDDNH